ncbi:low molecular weight phosphotyrosine protein phosphatase-like protein [Leptotrombidium deliense]|uniref:Low molecular weight phosphotyrosine protein phosphatase n=1 Tax=Leptotrombidium deliense TaxID=299467 RepID=A0A443SKZ1_9ACAR|nr:low molecular weight phosphotyrosine protein phosphatase-like protein [Leptotrombidium deliense]
MSTQKKSVLFVCLGNICRSPIAEAVFKQVIAQRNIAHKWVGDSCAIGTWHVGRGPDSRALTVLKQHGVNYEHTARQICDKDYVEFDYIFGMDDSNMSDIHEMAPKKVTANIALLGSHHPQGPTIIEDPYYDRGIDGFERVYDKCLKSINSFLDKVDN